MAVAPPSPRLRLVELANLDAALHLIGTLMESPTELILDVLRRVEADLVANQTSDLARTLLTVCQANIVIVKAVRQAKLTIDPDHFAKTEAKAIEDSREIIRKSGEDPDSYSFTRKKKSGDSDTDLVKAILSIIGSGSRMGSTPEKSAPHTHGREASWDN